MQRILLIFTLFLSSRQLTAQSRIIAFPAQTDLVTKEFSKEKNLIPLAIIEYSEDNSTVKIPIFYSLFHYQIDSNLFLIKGEYLNSYSMKLEKDGKVRPMFKPGALRLPQDHEIYLTNTINTIDSARAQGKIKGIIHLYNEPDWLQYDMTPMTKTGKPMLFICQVDFESIVNSAIVMDSPVIYIFYDPVSKMIKYVYQWD